jgi:hypothetical protein
MRVKAVEYTAPYKGDNHMKRTPAIALFALSFLGVAARVVAQEPALRANVPFEFTAGGRLLPADIYYIRSAATGIIQIQSADRHICVWTATSRDYNRPRKAEAELVFTKYGDRYFLHEVLSATTASLNAEVPASKLEKELRTQARLNQREPVLVAAR